MRLIFSFILCLILTGFAQAQAQLKPPTETALDRFLRYVKIDTQSQEDQTTTPSTRKQLNLANLLAKELTAFGAENLNSSRPDFCREKLSPKRHKRTQRVCIPVL